MVKVDSLLRPEWTYNQPNTSTYAEYFRFVQPTTRGDILFGGTRLDLVTERYYGLIASFTAAGVSRWEYQRHFGANPAHSTGFATIVSSPDSSAYVMGGTKLGNSTPYYEDYFARFANVGAPFVAAFCRVPPQAVLGYQFTSGGDSLRVVSLSTAGPRYAQLALWHWDFGDGSSYDGPSPPPHHYPAGTGVGTRVRLTVTNNLGCTSTQSVLPFALPTAGARPEPAAGQLYPNPTTGRVTLVVGGLGPTGAGAVEVVNGLGQVVWRQAVAVRAGQVREELELGTLPPGVYSLGLRTAQGRRVLRLVRQ